MAETIKVILDISDEVQELLDLQGVNLPQAVQEELPQIQLTDMTDPESPPGSKDITTVILATAPLISALTPIITRILNQFKPDTSEMHIEEKITYTTDGKPEYTRILISTEKKYNQQASIGGSGKSKKPELPKPGDNSGGLLENHTSESNEQQE